MVHVGLGGAHASSFFAGALSARPQGAGGGALAGLDGVLARQLKEKHARVAPSAEAFDALAAGAGGGGAPSTHKLPDGTAVVLGAQDCASCGEAFFRPELFGDAPGGAALRQGCGLPTAAMRAVLNCPVAIRPSLYQNVILCGGTTLMPGFVERFTGELSALAPAVHAVGLHSTKVELKVAASEDRAAAVWRGPRCSPACPSSRSSASPSQSTMSRGPPSSTTRPSERGGSGLWPGARACGCRRRWRDARDLSQHARILHVCVSVAI